MKSKMLEWNKQIEDKLIILGNFACNPSKIISMDCFDLEMVIILYFEGDITWQLRADTEAEYYFFLGLLEEVAGL